MNVLGTDFDTVLTRGALAALAAAAAWSVAVVVAVALEAGSGGRVQVAGHTGCPPAVRLWLLGLFVALLAGATPARASDPGPHARPDRDRVAATGPGEAVAAALDGLPLPDRPTGRTTRGVCQIVVHVGDSLWQIARERLPTAATDADVSAVVDALYVANRRQIGPDPDRIRPGQHLDFPDPITLPEEP